jgi:hypothetical protein
VKQSGKNLKKYPTIGVCGLDCGLCPRYHTTGTSRCPGCGGPDFFNKHPSCSFITCCVKKKNLEVCAECAEFPCPKFKSEDEYWQMKESSSYPPGRKIIPNLSFIREHGIEKFVAQQKERIKLLGMMIGNFNDGRSKSFYCKAAALLEVGKIEEALKKAVQQIKSDNIGQNDSKVKAGILRGILSENAFA